MASREETYLLWPNGAPGAKGSEESDKPRIVIFHAEGSTPRPGLVIFPGGAYCGLAANHEGRDIALWLNQHGISGAVCYYRHDNSSSPGSGYKHPYPALDAQRAVRTLRAKAEMWNLDSKKIGAVGFSAGGHLASTLATRPEEIDSTSADPTDHFSCRPDFLVLGYAVIGLNKPYTHKASQGHLLDPNTSLETVISLSNEEQVSGNTPPTFLFHTSEDEPVPAENSVQFYLSCIKHHVPAELHVYAKGRHGLGLAKGIPGIESWPRLCIQWLYNIGVVEPTPDGSK